MTQDELALRRRVEALERQMQVLSGRGHVPLRVPLAGVAGGVPMVKELPPIPTRGRKVVFWASSATLTGADGDDQCWAAHAEQDRWYPQDKPTALNGTPG